MKLLGKLVMLIVVVLAVLVLARNGVVKAVAEGGVRAVTGMPLSIEKLDIGLSTTLLDIESLIVKNPDGFHDTEFVNIPKILVDYNLGDILRGNIHLEDLEFNMSQFTLVKNEKGELNLDRLKALQGTKPAPAETKKQEPKAPAKAMPIQIDRFRLKVGKVVYVDYSSGKPVTKEFLFNLDETYQDITDPNKLVSLIVFKIMTKSALANLTNFDIGSLEGTVSGVVGSATDVAAKGLDAVKSAAQDPAALAGQTGAALKSTTGAVTDTAKELTSSVSGAASSLKKLNPFAKSE